VNVAPRLVIEDGAGRRDLPLAEGRLTVGRGPEGNGLRLEERNVSRRHAALEVSGGAVTIEDLGSRTGTWVNGDRISGRRRLHPGDRVRIGDFDLLLEAGTGELALARETTAERALPPALPNRHTPRQLPAPPAPAPTPSPLRRAADVAVRAVEAVVDKARGR
jgi:pSer/pThr/pTyr-binding forkhead associated (FHA) protein